MAEFESDRRRRDAAGVGPSAGDENKLVPLHELEGWTVAEGEPDIRLWEVRTVGGRELGRVSELLVDPDAGEVVMLDVDLTGEAREALVPIRIVQIDRVARVVLVDSADVVPAEAAWRDEEEVVVDRPPELEEILIKPGVFETVDLPPPEEAATLRGVDAEVKHPPIAGADVNRSRSDADDATKLPAPPSAPKRDAEESPRETND